MIAFSLLPQLWSLKIIFNFSLFIKNYELPNPVKSNQKYGLCLAKGEISTPRHTSLRFLSSLQASSLGWCLGKTKAKKSHPSPQNSGFCNIRSQNASCPCISTECKLQSQTNVGSNSTFLLTTWPWAAHLASLSLGFHLYRGVNNPLSQKFKSQGPNRGLGLG